MISKPDKLFPKKVYDRIKKENGLVSYDGTNLKDADGNVINVGGSTQLYMHFITVNDVMTGIGQYQIVNTHNESINLAYLYSLLEDDNPIALTGISDSGDTALLKYDSKDEIFIQKIGSNGMYNEVTDIIDNIKSLT